MPHGHVFTVGDWKVHVRLHELSGPGGTARVEPKSMQVLAELARHAGEVRTRAELLDAVWGDQIVGDEVHSHSNCDMSRALDDKDRPTRYIQTVPRQGYRLIVPVSWLDGEAGESPRYRRTEKLAAGGMGEIWKAEDTRLHRTVALKFLPFEWSRDPAAKRRLLREARAAAALDHPNVCTVHDVDETRDGQLFLVMAHYDGQTLKERMAGGPLPWREAARLAGEVADGLAAAHAAGIVHRDVKAANAVVTAGGGVKVLDFGLAQSADLTELTQKTTSPGTPAYMSPEQLTGGEIDHRTDVWSLGVLLYELLAGHKPFPGGSSDAVIYSVLHNDPGPLPAGLPAPLAKLVMEILRKDPAERVESAGAVRDRLAEILGHDSPGRPAGSPTAEAVAPPMRRASRPWLTRAAWAAALVAGLSAALFFARPRPAAPVRVAVLAPETRESVPGRLRLAASGVRMAVIDALAEAPSASPVEPEELAGEAGSAVEVARAVAADEVLRTTLLGPVDGLCQVSLRRVRGSDGEVLWSDAFEAPLEAADLMPLYEAVRVRLRAAYAGHGRGDPESAPAVGEEDYAEFLEIRQAADADGADVERLLARLETLLATSPDFVAAHLAVADLSRSLYSRSRRDADLAKGLHHARVAGELAPDDVRPRIWEHQLLIAANRHDEASSSLDEVAAIDPAYQGLPVLRSRLAEKAGRADEALRHIRAAVERYPSWQRLLRQADLEFRFGRPDEARTTLERLLERSPKNHWGLAKLAEVEMLYGDLGRAEEIYLGLTETAAPKIGDLINLGLVRSLTARHRAAVETFRRALELHPGHPTVLLNLADAELALGEEEEARSHYRQVLDLLSGDLGPIEKMFKAQCLVHLDQVPEAIRLTQEAQRLAPEDSEVTFLAALVYALAGEPTSAFVNSQLAVEKGVQRIWFDLPAFDPLRGDEAFRALVAEPVADD